MKIWTTLFTLLITTSGFAADTAYSALRVLSTKYGESTLSRVLEVRGGRGTWKVILADPRLRTGLREVQVSEGRIRSNGMAILELHGNGAINVNALNLDSDGALATVNQQLGQPIAEDLLHYTLANGTDGTPIWTVAIRHQREGDLSSIQIAANTGVIVATSLRPGSQNGVVADRDAISKPEPEPDELGGTGATNEKSKPRSRNSGAKRDVHGLPDIAERLAERVESRGRHLRDFLPF